MELILYIMNKNCGIYKITSPTGRVYIGQSVDIYKRWRKYKSINCPKQYKILNSFLKYGVENHQFNIIEYCLIENLDCSERFWQDEFDVLNGGLNCVLQECGEKRKVISEESKKNLSKINTGKKHSKETRKKMSKSAKGVPKSEEARKNMKGCQKGALSSCFGKNLSEEHKRNMALGKKPLVHTKEAKEKMSLSKIGVNNVTSKLVLDTQTGIFYYCIREASEAHNINYSILRNMFSEKNSLKNTTNLIKV